MIKHKRTIKITWYVIQIEFYSVTKKLKLRFFEEYRLIWKTLCGRQGLNRVHKRQILYVLPQMKI